MPRHNDKNKQERQTRAKQEYTSKQTKKEKDKPDERTKR